MIRIHAADLAPDRRLGFAVRDGHRVEAAVLALVLHADRGAKARQDLLAGQVGEMDRELDELTHAAVTPWRSNDSAPAGATASDKRARRFRCDAREPTGERIMPAKFVKTIGRTLDARPDRLDLRDREFTPNVVSLPQQWPDDATIRRLLPRYCKSGLVLNQGVEGACTGFGLACVVNYLHWRVALEEGKARSRQHPVSPRMLFHLARFYDEWPGEDYDGSSCRGALKAWHKHGVCTDRPVALSRCRRARALPQAARQVGRGRAATAARRLLPRQSRVGRRHAGGDSRDRRDLRVGRRARRLGHRGAQQVHHRTCFAAGGRSR